MYTLQQRRSKAYVAFAAANGYLYVAKRPGQEVSYVEVLPMFNQGHGRTWQHEISGSFNGLPFTAFEYVKFVGYCKSASTCRRWSGRRALAPHSRSSCWALRASPQVSGKPWDGLTSISVRTRHSPAAMC